MMRSLITAATLLLIGATPAFAQSHQPVQGETVTELNLVPSVEGDSLNNNVSESPDAYPEYPGGVEGIVKFLVENLRYPEDAYSLNIQGRVIVRFVVDTEGHVTDPEVVGSVYPSLDAEALRVVSLLNGFTPGIKDVKAVRTWYTLPISFRIPDPQD